MSDQTIEQALVKRCNGRADCKGYGIHRPGCVKNLADNAKYLRK